MKDLSILEDRIGVTFNNKQLLIDALTYFPQYFIRVDNKPHPNERLEHLGDTIFGMIVTEYLFKNFPDWDEWMMTEVRSNLINAQTAMRVAEDLELGDFLILSSEVNDYVNLRFDQWILADSFEALVAAIYLDQGLEAAHKFISTFILEPFDFYSITLSDAMHPKTRLQFFVQKHFRTNPYYRIIKFPRRGIRESRFVIGFYLKDRLVSQGVGRRKEEAERSASEEAFEILSKEVTVQVE